MTLGMPHSGVTPTAKVYHPVCVPKLMRSRICVPPIPSSTAVTHLQGQRAHAELGQLAQKVVAQSAAIRARAPPQDPTSIQLQYGGHLSPARVAT